MHEAAIEELELVQIAKIELKDGTEIDFSEDLAGYGIIKNDMVVRIYFDGRTEKYPMNEIKKLYVEKFDFGKSLIAITLIPLGVMVIITFIFWGLLSLNS
jgi:hypothetical protein